jgi:deoxyribodipyrimidine photo-lyase
LPAADRRVEFIRESLVELEAELRALGGGLIVRHAAAVDEIPALARDLDVQAVFANRDDEPDALARDARVFGALANAGITFHTYKDSTVFDRDEVMTQTGQPYTVFTPYKRAWLAKVDSFFLKPYPVRGHADALAPPPEAYLAPVPVARRHRLRQEQPLGAGHSHRHAGRLGALRGLLPAHRPLRHRARLPRGARPELPGRAPALRHGVDPADGGVAHQLSLQGDSGAATWLSELVWREFYFQILAHFPHVHSNGESKSFRPEYDKIQWHHGKHADQLFDAWCQGRTGYPLVDAAMLQINQSGYMHNRLRMVVASFLCKDLGLDWRRGERYFALHLNDFELASNNGGWQWASSTGCDAQPYFRIFNPVTQSERFDPEGKFIRRYLPQLAGLSNAAIHAPWMASPVELEAAGIKLGETYPMPVVDHAEAREKTLQRYGVARAKALQK